MNVIVVMSDTFRRDHLAAYGAPAPWTRPGHDGEPFVATPNLDRLAAESALFERCYLGSYPTVPCRYDLFAGRYGFPHRGWQPLEPEDVILSEITAGHGFTPMMIFDTPMLATDSYNYTRGFAGWDFVRGQHADRFVVDPIPTRLPAAPHTLKNLAATHLYLRNTAFRTSEHDWMAGRTLGRTMEWLERNRSRDDFVLWVDLWDPHEPFDAPDFDLARYADPAYDGDEIIYPRYGRGDYMSDAERNHVRTLYAALVTLVDRWMGRLLEKVATLGLDKNTLLVFLSDHGHLFGDHGLQGKPTGPLGKLYEVTTRVPLLIRHPQGIGAGQRIGGIAQHPDILPTVLEFLGVPTPSTAQGQSLWPLIKGETEDVHEFAISGRHSRADMWGGAAKRPADAAAFDGTAGLATPGEPLTVTTRQWTYICPARDGEARELYDVDGDPGQRENVLDRHPDVADELHRTLIEALDELGMAPDRLTYYRDQDPTAERPALLPNDLALSVIDDGRGHLLAFTRPEEAVACLSPAVPARTVWETTLGRLRTEQPRALVAAHDQYYWAEDLA